MDRQAATDCGGWRAGHNGGDRPRLQSALPARAAARPLVGHLGRLGDLVANLEHHRSMLAPDRQIARAPRRHAASGCVRTTPAMPSMTASTSPGAPARAASRRIRCEHRRLGFAMAPRLPPTWRLPSLAPQVSQVGNAALIEREAITLPLDHAISFELADVGPAAIEMQRQCRRADGRGPHWRRAGHQR